MTIEYINDEGIVVIASEANPLPVELAGGGGMQPSDINATSPIQWDSSTTTISFDDTGYAKTGDLFSGKYSDLTGKPTIPSKVSDLSDAGDYAKTSSLATVATSGSYGDLSDTPSLADVATSGSYNDLSNTPAPQDASQVALTSTVSGESDVQAALAALETRIAALEP